MKFIKIIKNTIQTELARLYIFLTRLNIKNEIWVIGETELQAQENGYELYKWIKENAPEVSVYYILDRKSPALNKFIGDPGLLLKNTFKSAVILFSATRIISTHGLWMVPDELGILKKHTRKTLRAKKVMLNHGLCFLKNGVKYYHKSKFALNDLITVLSPRHKEIFTKIYGYDESEIVISGYPRFDNMNDESDKSLYNNMIIIMPTFRDGEQKLGNAFQKTELFIRIVEFIKNSRTLDLIEKRDCNIGIYLHQNIQDCTKYFEPYTSNRIHVFNQEEQTVTSLLKNSKLLITDYSSVLFDMSYMNKPFISYQFDREKFLASREDKPIIDISRDIPGDVVDTSEDLFKAVEFYIENGFKIKEKYKSSISSFFTFQDNENCKRVFDSIKKIT